MKDIKNILISILISLGICMTGSLVGYAYFKWQVTSEVDLEFTTGSLDVGIDEGLNTILNSGESSEYKEFNITNKGTLNQNIEISFENLNNYPEEILKNINYELDLKESENTYTTVVNTNLEELKNTNLKYKLNRNEHLSFRSKTYISDNIEILDEDKTINLKLKVKSSQVNLH